MRDTSWASVSGEWVPDSEMDVWFVMDESDYYGPDVVAVFLSRGEAEGAAVALCLDDPRRDGWVYVRGVPAGMDLQRGWVLG